MKLLWNKIVKNFDAPTVARGLQYFFAGYVESARWVERDDEGGKILGVVSGSGGAHYQQAISLVATGNVVGVHGTCTCPVGNNCKHVLAALKLAQATVDIENGGTGLEDDDTLFADSVATTIAGLRHPNVAEDAPLPYEIELWMTRVAKASAPETDDYPAETSDRLFYVFEQNPKRTHHADDIVHIALKTARILKNGKLNRPAPFRHANATHAPPSYMLGTDRTILRGLMAQRDFYTYGYDFPVEGIANNELIPLILATGRARFNVVDSAPLELGAERAAKLTWRTLTNGNTEAAFIAEPAATAVIPSSPPWYIDVATSTCGPLATAMPDAMAAAIITGPALTAAEVSQVARALTKRNLQSLVTVPEQVTEVTLDDYQPTPILTLKSHKVEGWNRLTGYVVHTFMETARLEFEYLGVRVSAVHPAEITRFIDHRIQRARRNRDAEKQARALLRKGGLDAIEKVMVRGISKAMLGTFVTTELDADAGWLAFVQNHLPALRLAGWRIEMDPKFRFDIAEVGEWYGEVEDGGHAWFNLEIGIEVDGKRVSLIPILVRLIRSSPHDWSGDALTRRADDAPILVPLPDGRSASLPFGRVRSILTVLYEIAMREEFAGGKARLPALDAARLADLDAALKLRWMGGERLRALGEKLAGFTGIAPVATPKNFHATLRPYQEAGLAWLQFLTQHQLAGVLADDMGLGKTVQTLAHILTEKQHGRLAAPVLVVAPTSMMNVWQSEAAKFTPSLTVLLSHGLARKSGFEKMRVHDIVLTTYALMSRDEAELKKIKWHILILDEAQNIKNPKTKAAAIVSMLDAKHRLCLTGTPMENHLGELWSLFNFLMPGFLGDERGFRERYRTPIEREGDSARRQFLARRIKPFLLRRTKSAVANDLPAKTEITQTVDISGAQADLYETVRVAMDKRVRDEIAAHGIAKSHIIVLDALLKLRQICCDPRLVKSITDVKKKAVPSAKLEMLLEMLDELLEEGRAILVFSQFASMLTLIEAELAKKKIAYVKLTGQTKDRKTPVDAFQRGEVKVFLISLKAGGTGLTLTAADTVIHYDPWWNPAVENQATDRAHRIGQDKPVFVYKLVAKGTVEEKIVALQAGKAALAAGILSGEAGATKGLTADDLKALFEPS